MTEKTEKKLDKITKYGNRIIWIAISAIITVFCVSHYEGASKSLEAWRKYPDVFRCVENQPAIDQAQDEQIKAAVESIKADKQEAVDVQKDIKVTLKLLLNSNNEIRERLDLYPLYIPDRREASLSPKVK